MPKPKATPTPPAIRYGKMVINGITVRPNSQEVLRKAVEGHPIEFASNNDYINLYHVFERMVEKDRKLANHQLTRRQVGKSQWLAYVTDDPSAVPEPELQAGYDPVRGRYKRYVELLASGETVRLESRTEAVKVRKAWQLYVPREKRRHLMSTVKKVPRTREYDVVIVQRLK